ncbi:MAG: metallophosphoesterase family protein [Halobacteriales archaeon]
MDIAILSDTHIPGQADAVPDPFRDRVREADRVIHAGDFGSVDAYADLAGLADGVTAVYGNADPRNIDLPPVASIRVGGVTFVVVHGVVNRVERAVASSEAVVTDREGWLDAVADVTRARAGEDAVGIGGHSHEVEDVVHDGLRLLNPGSATDVGRAEGATMLTATVEEGTLDVTVHER